jgi:hypothetical protein
MTSSFKSDAIGDRLGGLFISTSANPREVTSGASVVFRREFELASRPKRTVLRLFADARYVLWVNGKYVTRGPVRFEPQAPEYDTIDLSRNLHQGHNVIAILVTGRISNGKIRWRPIGLSAELGSSSGVSLTTDSSWKWSDDTRYRGVKIDWADVYDIADARGENGDWTQPGYDDSHWHQAERVARNPEPLHIRTVVDDSEHDLLISPIGPSWWGPLSARRIPPLRETPVVPQMSHALPVDLEAGQELKIQFPHMVLATTEFVLEATEGSEIELTYSPGTHYICRAGRQRFLTSDTHSIYEGAFRVKSGHVRLLGLEFRERLYPFTQAGVFHSSAPLLDQIWRTCVRGLEITSEDSYVDCADRERVEWMDTDPPAFDVTRVAMVGPDQRVADPRLLESMIRRTALTLQPDGWVKAHTCSDRFDIHAKMEDRACDWVEGARRYVETSGKLGVIREIWPAIVTQMNYFLARKGAHGLVLAREWEVWGNPLGYQTCEGTALNCFIVKGLRDAAYLGRRIGQRKEADRFDREAAELTTTINEKLWDESAGTYYGGFYDEAIARQAKDYRPLTLKVTDGLVEPTRHAALFALDQDIVPADRVKPVRAYLMANAPTDDSIMQYYYFWRQAYLLDNAGTDRSVLDTMRRQWKDMSEDPFGATYEGLHRSGSRAHGYGMFPAYFLSSYVLGVRKSDHGWLIEPRLGDLHSAGGRVVTESGVVSVDWRLTSSGGKYHLELPKGMSATLHLPGPPTDAHLRPHAHKAGRWWEIPNVAGSLSGDWTAN